MTYTMRRFISRTRSLAFLGMICVLTIVTTHHANANEDAAGSGSTLYKAQCSSCHGANLEGADAPSLRNVSRMKVEFDLTTGRMPRSDAGSTTAKAPPLLPAQIDAIVDFVMSRSHGSNAQIYVSPTGNIQRGRALFIANCSACHGVTAKGTAVGFGMRAPNLDSSTPTQLAQAIRIGPGVMPVFDRHTLSGAEVSDIVRYVKVLQRSPLQAGGIPLGNIGAVAEGMVAWILGLGLMVIVTRLLGTKT